MPLLLTFLIHGVILGKGSLCYGMYEKVIKRLSTQMACCSFVFILILVIWPCPSVGHIHENFEILRDNYVTQQMLCFKVFSKFYAGAYTSK